MTGLMDYPNSTHWSSRNAVHLTVRGELAEPPPSQLEPFDKLRANGIFLKGASKNSSFPRRRESSLLILLDSRLRGSDEI